MNLLLLITCKVSYVFSNKVLIQNNFENNTYLQYGAVRSIKKLIESACYLWQLML
jgi:hypothetical protein